jgi:MYXO-CTERM domain-containing protein
LSSQIVGEVQCLDANALFLFAPGGGLTFSSNAVIPYLEPSARADLFDAVVSSNDELIVNSAFRTVAQQYLIRRWFEAGRCGITAAAQPGNSNHESGRALDIGNFDIWVTTLAGFGWDQTVPGDPVHFDHLASPDQRGIDVLAFQLLWNRNNPADQITEDMQFGPETEARMKISPAEGFPLGPDCSGNVAPSEYSAAFENAELPEVIVSNAVRSGWIELRNTGNTTWTAGEVFLGAVSPATGVSAFYDESAWLTPTQAVALDRDVTPNDGYRFNFSIVAPLVDEDTEISESFALFLASGGRFGPSDLTVDIIIRPPGSPPVLPEEDGGCNVSSSSHGSWWLLTCVLIALRRRRRSADPMPSGGA